MHEPKEVIDESLEILDEIKFETRCHLFRTNLRTGQDVTGFSICGVPRSEQPVHYPSIEAGIESAKRRDPFCPWCGYKRCEKCNKF